MGDPATSGQRLNLAQAFNPPGTITGALIGTVFIFSGVELTPTKVSALKASGEYAAYLHHETLRVIAPYLVLSCPVLLMSMALLKVNSRLPPPSMAASHICFTILILCRQSWHSFFTLVLKWAPGAT
jgi:FHS family L-fucose permease-like MFS transporter